MKTMHSAKRATQRGIPELAIELVLQFGVDIHDKSGAVITALDKRGRKQLTKAVGQLAAKTLAKFLDIYIVHSNDGTIITVAHRYRRVKERA